MVLDELGDFSIDEWRAARDELIAAGVLRVSEPERLFWLVNATKPQYNLPDNPRTAASWARKLAQFDLHGLAKEYLKEILEASSSWAESQRKAFEDALDECGILGELANGSLTSQDLFANKSGPVSEQVENSSRIVLRSTASASPNVVLDSDPKCSSGSSDPGRRPARSPASGSTSEKKPNAKATSRKSSSRSTANEAIHPAVIGLMNEYYRKAEKLGHSWVRGETTSEDWKLAEKALDKCNEHEKSSKLLLEFTFEKFPRVTKGRNNLPGWGYIASDKTLKEFLSYDPNGTSDSQVHDSISTDKKYEDYPRDLAELLRQAGLDVPKIEDVKDESRIGRVVLGVKREVEKLPRVANLMYPLHVCFLASTQRPEELKQWVTRDDKPLPIIREQWAKVQEFARSQARNGRAALWMPLVNLARELEAAK